MTAPGRVTTILAAHSKRGRVSVGGTVTVFPERVLLDDRAALEVVSAHRALERQKVRQPDRYLWIPGAADSDVEQQPLVDFAHQHGLAVPFDPYHAGRLSVLAAEAGAVGSDDIVVSMNPEAGALGGLGAVVMKTDAASLSGLMIGRPVEVAVPPTRTVEVTGRLPRWSGPFDLALALLDVVGDERAVLELYGETLTALPIPDRLELCGALACAGWAAVVRPDEQTALWLQTRRPAAAPTPPVSPSRPRPSRRTGAAPSSGPAAAAAPAADPSAGPSARPSAEVGPDLTLDARQALPRALLGGWSGQAVRPGGPPHPLSVVVLGGHLESLRVAAKVLRERNVHPGLALFVSPGSQRVLLHAIEEGLAGDLVRAGAVLLPPGSRSPASQIKRQRLSTLPESGEPALCSPAMAAASAATGVLSDPEAVFRLRREGRRRA